MLILVLVVVRFQKCEENSQPSHDCQSWSIIEVGAKTSMHVLLSEKPNDLAGFFKEAGSSYIHHRAAQLIRKA